MNEDQRIFLSPALVAVQLNRCKKGKIFYTTKSQSSQRKIENLCVLCAFVVRFGCGLSAWG
jgi:hypothetical protein